MDTDKCLALLEVLECGSISAAAKKLEYTVSGISRMMAALEAESGFPLLVRSKNGVLPTENCKRILPTIRELAHMGELYKKRCLSIRGVEEGIIRVGSVYSAYYDWLAKVIADFSLQHPGIEISFLQGSSSEFYYMLDNHEIDFCIVSHREKDYDFCLLKKDPLVAWVGNNHPCVSKKIYPLKNFEKDLYINTYPEQDTDNSRVFRTHGIYPRSQFVSIDVKATKAMVKAGLGVSLNNAIISRDIDTEGITVLPTEPLYEVDIGIATPRAKDRSPAANKFLEFALGKIQSII